MRKAILILTAFAAACASAPKAPVNSESTELQADRITATTLRSIAARVKKGEADKVRSELNEQQKAKPDDTKIPLFLAWIRAPEESAWEDISNIGKMSPDERWAILCRGEIYLQWRKHFLDQADGEFARVLKKSPNSVPALTGHADVLRLKGQLPEAKAAYEAVLARVPDWHEALAGIALTLDAMKDANARAALDRALASDPDDIEVLAAAARLAMAANDADAALKYYERLAQFDGCQPDNAQGCAERTRENHIAFAALKQARGDVAGAAEQLDAALAIREDAATARQLADARRTAGDADGEAKALAMVARLDSADASAMLRLAELERARDNSAAAQDALREAARRRPTDGAIRLAIARNARELGDLVAAVESYRVAAANGASEAAPELKEIEARASINQRPARGDPNAVYGEVFARLRAKVAELQKKGEHPAGKLNVRVAIGADGKASQIEFLEDSVKHNIIRALVYFSLKDAIYPKAARTPVFEFTVK